MNVVLIQRQSDNPCNINTSSHLLQWRLRLFHLQRSGWPQFLGIQKVLHLLTIIKRVTPSMESVLPTCWGSYKRLSRPNTQENWCKGSCFIRTMLHHTSTWFHWLLCMTLALNWFGPIYHHLITMYQAMDLLIHSCIFIAFLDIKNIFFSKKSLIGWTLLF